jgi:hypothetical protein
VCQPDLAPLGPVLMPCHSQELAILAWSLRRRRHDNPVVGKVTQVVEMAGTAARSGSCSPARAAA